MYREDSTHARQASRHFIPEANTSPGTAKDERVFQAQTSWKLALTGIKNQEALGWKTAGALCSANASCGF